jgi:glycosyltransferase involved in cell wall biosynthesis
LSRVLWIVQDGVLAGPGASQTVPYLVGLAGRGHEMALLSFEHDRFRNDPDRLRAVADRLREAGVSWQALPFGQGATVPRTIRQIRRAATVIRHHRPDFDFLHARSYVPALIAARSKRPYLFDMRGLWPREKVDGGLWSERGLMYRLWRWRERKLLAGAAAVVLLAHGAKEHLPEIRVPVAVIPTAVDLDRFRPGLPRPPGAGHLAGRRVFAICGALGGWYRLEEMLDLSALAIRRGDADHVLILSEEERRPAVEGLRSRGVPAEAITDRGVPHEQAPLWFSLASAGILLIESAPSKRASAPTKLAEFLACGVPVVITPGIGDTEELLARTETGVIVRGHDAAAHQAALIELAALRRDRDGLARRCRETAERELSLTAAVRRYADLYAKLMERIT